MKFDRLKEEKLEKAMQDEKYNDEAYFRIVTLVLPSNIDITPIMEWAGSVDAIGHDAVIHKDSLTDEKAWRQIGNGISGAYKCHFEREARNALRPPWEE